MRNLLNPYTGLIYALFRFFTGLLFLFHGTQKLFGWPGDRAPVSLASLAGLAGMIETMGGTMVAIGFWAAPAAFIASGTMAVAYVLRHAGQDLFPILNRGELALVYCFAFLLIAATGSGRFSVDGCWRARRSGGR